MFKSRARLSWWTPSFCAGTLSVCAILAGCVGTVAPPTVGGAGDSSGSTPSGGGGSGTVVTVDNNPAQAPAVFACDPAAAIQNEQLRRLTTVQYTNTAHDLFAFGLKDSGQADAVMTEIAGILPLIPVDTTIPSTKITIDADPHGTFRRLSQTMQSDNVKGYYYVGEAAGKALTKTSDRLGALAGSCATDNNAANDDQCVTDFVKNFGQRALRRPLTSAEVTTYKAFYAPSTGIDPAGFAEIISAFMQAPEFIYIMEHGDTPSPGKTNVYQLTAYELAQRLSYQFWNTSPDDELFSAAASGALKTANGYKAQVDRVFADPRTQTTIAEFYSDLFEGVYQTKESLDRNNAMPAFKTFAGSDLPTMDLGAHEIDEVMGLASYLTWTKPGAYADFLTNNQSFAKTGDLAKIYGVSTWDGTSDPPSLPDNQRPGYLSRALYQSTGLVTTRPIMKGIYIRRTVLCDKIDPPPPGVKAAAQPADPTKSSRQVIEALTEVPGSNCNGCHGLQINGLGYPTESFDGLGRARTEETLFAADGTVSNKVPVNTVSTPRLEITDSTTQVSNARELMDKIVDSGKGAACFVRQYFRFTYGRWEDVQLDGCLLESLRSSLENDGTVAGMLKGMAMAPEFQQRSFR